MCCSDVGGSKPLAVLSGGLAGHAPQHFLVGCPYYAYVSYDLPVPAWLELVWSSRYIAYQLDRSGYEDVFYILASTTSNATEESGESTSNFLLTSMLCCFSRRWNHGSQNLLWANSPRKCISTSVSMCVQVWVCMWKWGLWGGWKCSSLLWLVVWIMG